MKSIIRSNLLKISLMPNKTHTACHRLMLFISLAMPLMSQNSFAQASCEANSKLNNFVSEKYPQDISFDVFRNNKKVGEHTTHFTRDAGQLAVKSQMKLLIKVLFLTVYEFEYISQANWCGDKLFQLDASTNRNGDLSNVRAVSSTQGVQLTSSLGSVTAPAEIIPTNHWNPAVLKESTVLNTITGGLNQVSIKRCEIGTESVENAAPGAVCYQYSGELETRVWYDDQGRWRGLEFSGDDGSTITYVCQRCS